MPAPQKMNSSLKLPCGLELLNRLAKSAMSENLAFNHRPNPQLVKLYERFGSGGAGLVVTGNVMVDGTALGEPHNLVVEDESSLEALADIARAGQAHGSKLFMQVNHPGRQSPSILSPEPVAPSAIQLGGSLSMGFNRPRALTTLEIKDIIQRFGKTTAIAEKAGFAGAQIHGAHGYLVSQFFSPLSNQRTDDWGGSHENRMRFAIEVYQAMRENTGSDFAISIKLNSADFQRGGFSEQESEEVVQALAAQGIDLVEISGGTYEKAAMTGVSQKQSTLQREAYFLDYAEKLRRLIDVPLMVTGGFRSSRAIEQALQDGALDLAGLARPMAIDPALPAKLLSDINTSSTIKPVRTGVDAIDKAGFLEIGWYELQLERLSQGKSGDPKLNPWWALALLAAKGGLASLGKRRG